MLTYKSLYSLVDEQINKKIDYRSTDAYKVGEQLSRSQSMSEPFMMPGSGRRDITAQELIQAMQTVLDEALPDNIIEGLEVTATNPISNAVVISAGKGSTGGVIYELSEDITVTVPFDSVTQIFYVNLHKNRILLDKKADSSKLNIAKIIVPKPGATNKIKDRKEDDFPWDAYIVNLNIYDLYGINDKLEEDSIDLLRDNIGDILADNLIGNLRLSENLKILNTAGTLELDSKSVKMFDENENKMAEFNKNGTFFYDVSGREIAKFSIDEARIGNIKILVDRIQSENFVSGSTGFEFKDDGTGAVGGILITSNTLESSNFVSGFFGKGFQITSSGNAEFQNIRARGKIVTSVFEKGAISSVGGIFAVLDSDVLEEDMTASSTTMVISGDTTFTTNDILRIKVGTDDEWLEVTAVDGNTYTVARDKVGDYGSSCPAWKKGTCVVNYGQSGEGGIIMTSSEIYSPYMDFFTHTGSPWSSLVNKTRIGNLDGIAGASGYGIWGGDGYLGALEVIDTIGISAEGSIRSNLTGNYPYLEFSQSGLQLKSSPAGASYGVGKYGTSKYGYGAVAWIMNSDLKIPLAVIEEPGDVGATVADIRYYNRSSDPSGPAEVGDTCVVNGTLKICTGAGTPGTWAAV